MTTVREHLEAALTTGEPSDMRYHIREALQLLAAETEPTIQETTSAVLAYARGRTLHLETDGQPTEWLMSPDTIDLGQWR